MFAGHMGIKSAVDYLGPHKIDVDLPGELSLRSQLLGLGEHHLSV